MNNNFLIKLNNISYIKNSKYLVKDISFEIKNNEIVTIVGKNGAGKSTLCKIIVGLISPSYGTLEKHNNIKIRYIPQIDSQNTLVPMKIIDFLLLNNKKSLTKEDLSLLKFINMDNNLDKQLKELSSGEKQKIILIRALISNPDLLILDEPLSSIDFSSRDEMYQLISDYKKKYKFSVLMVSHDLNIVLKNTDWVLCLRNGQIGCTGIPEMLNEADIINNISSHYSYYTHKD